MKWKVEGADANTGKDRRHFITAKSADEASQVAQRMLGMLVSSVEREREVVPPRPRYGALGALVLIIQMMGAFLVIVAGVAVVLVIVAATEKSAKSPGPAELLVILAVCGLPAVGGLMLLGLGELLTCVRDIAINSFPTRESNER